MPTKQELEDYFKEDTRTHTAYTASLHFNIDITKVYEIMEEKDE